MATKRIYVTDDQEAALDVALTLLRAAVFDGHVDQRTLSHLTDLRVKLKDQQR